jgi:LmbE family N-acetylglucosaminyl deacetylase
MILIGMQSHKSIAMYIGATVIIAFLLSANYYYAEITDPQGAYESFYGINDERILIIAPHPDDEVAMAGSIIVRHDPAKVSILYLTDGSYFSNPFIHRIYSKQRTREAYAAMGSLGITDMHFLGLKDQHIIRDRIGIAIAYSAIAEMISNKSPDIIIVPAYEGGHCVHDLANYMVSRAAKEAGFQGKIYEAALYNDYYSIDTPRKLIGKAAGAMGIRIGYPAMFLPKSAQQYDGTAYVIRSNDHILRQRKRVLGLYVSQNIEGSLTKKFGYPEMLREINNHDYNTAPYDLGKSFGYWHCIAMNFPNAIRCDRISVCKVTFDDYRTAMQMIEDIAG